MAPIKCLKKESTNFRSNVRFSRFAGLLLSRIFTATFLKKPRNLFARLGGRSFVAAAAPQIEHQQHTLLTEAKLVDWLELWHLNSEVGGTIPGRGKKITFQN